MTFRTDIQGLRALAVLLVLLAHFDVPPFAGGFVGVDVFFVISGFLITRILWRQLESEGRIRLAEFYARRLRRLLPVLVVMVGVTLAAALVLLSGLEIRSQTGSVPFALIWTSNLYFAFREMDYFAWLQNRDLYLHTWSLGVEEQFYLAWPLLLWILFRTVGKGRWSHFALAAVAALSLGFCIVTSAGQATLAFYLPVFRIWEFALGAWVYWQAANLARLSHFWGAVLVLVGLVAIGAAAVLFDHSLAYPGAWALVPAAGTALVLAGGPQLSRWLGNPILVWLGDRSYSLYLWHWPVFVLASAWAIDRSISAKAGLLGLCLVLAMASYRWIELPFWKGRFSRVGVPRQVFVTAAVVMAVGAVAGFVGAGLTGAVKARAEADLLAARSDLPAIYQVGCDHWYHDDELIRCRLGAREGKRTVILLGDSVAAQWVSVLPRVFPNDRIVVVTKSSCPMVDFPYFYERIGRVYEVCERWREKALRYVEESHPDFVFAGSASTYPFTESQWIEGSRRIWRRLAQAAGQVYIIAGTPHLDVDGPGCLARIRNRLYLAGRFCATLWRDDSDIAKVNRLLRQAAVTLPKVQVLDFADRVCPHGRCVALNDHGLVVFRDNQHLTNSFVVSLAETWRQRLSSSRDDAMLTRTMRQGRGHDRSVFPMPQMQGSPSGLE